MRTFHQDSAPKFTAEDVAKMVATEVSKAIQAKVYLLITWKSASKELHCLLFPITVIGITAESAHSLRPSGITGFKELKERFASICRVKRDLRELFAIEQERGDSLRLYYDQFLKVSSEIEGITPLECMSAFQRSLKNEELVKSLIITPASSFQDLTYKASQFMVVEESPLVGEKGKVRANEKKEERKNVAKKGEKMRKRATPISPFPLMPCGQLSSQKLRG
ncbi:hypothetical protein CRG98_028693 [Punica granatum]|uniref:Retrotransposon gag domain-containing protein n=1 Tax=Punica granatum TaxID=22663 RepID=A0A2I0J4I6_PUNGR|nr:hypothetical protein CRG98_028693 [Punica granatum]